MLPLSRTYAPLAAPPDRREQEKTKPSRRRDSEMQVVNDDMWIQIQEASLVELHIHRHKPCEPTGATCSYQGALVEKVPSRKQLNDDRSWEIHREIRLRCLEEQMDD